MLRAILIFIAVTLFAAAINPELVEFDKNYAALSKSEKFSLHQKLKTLYIKSIINRDENLQIEVLKRIIASSKELKLNYQSYENELNSLQKKRGFSPAAPLQKTNSQSKNKEIAKEQNKTPQTSVNTTKTSPNLQKTSVNTEQKINKIYILKITRFQVANKSGFVLKLKNSLSEKDISKSSYFEKNIHNTILSFDAILDTKKVNQNFADFELSVVQFNPKTSRIVLKSKNNYELKYTLNDNEIRVFVEKNSVLQSAKTVSNSQKNSSKINEIAKKDTKKTSFVVKNIKKTSSAIELILDKSLSEEDIKITHFKNNKIMEFPGVLLGKKRQFFFKNYTFTVLQYNPKTVRIVSNSNYSYSFLSNSLLFSVGQKAAAKSFNNNQKFANKKFLIAIDAGHGGKDAGANAYGRYEKNITLAIAKKLENKLRQKGYKVFLTRSNDTFINLRERTKMANKNKADLFISIHANSLANRKKADQIHGVETYFLSPARSSRSKNAAANENKGDVEEMNYFTKQTFLNFLNREKIISSNKLAIDIQSSILHSIPKSYKVRDGGVKEAPFWVLVGALMPAVLIEVGYITHPIEGKNIANSQYQDYIANGIVNGIDNYFAKNK